MTRSERITFPGHSGDMLAARLDLPAGPPLGYALFAHCFSCSMNVLAASRVSQGLVDEGFAVLRFDFTGLGASEGDFENTNFSSNVQDLVVAANWLTETYGRVDVLIGHSLGGAACIVAANQLPMVKAVATIGAPSDAGHVLNQISDHLGTIEDIGSADVKLAGRSFTILKQFVDDVRDAKVCHAASTLRRPLLVLHSPLDEVVGIENASGLFVAARHPKSFVSLDDADHLLTQPEDAAHASRVIAAWAETYIDVAAEAPPKAPTGSVRVKETGQGNYANFVVTDDHVLRADEPLNHGGLNTGPAPYDYLCAALGACTSMTIRMYAERKDWPVQSIRVDVRHDRSEQADETGRKADIFTRDLKIEGPLEADQLERLKEIADKCPVHRTLHAVSTIETRLSSNS